MATKKKKKKKSSILLKVILWVLMIIVAVGILCCALALGIYNGAKESSPEINETNVMPTTNPSSIYDINGKEMIQLSSEGARRTEATSEEIPDYLKWAFIDLEDERFYEHNGIDLKGIVRAAYVTLTTDRNEGASTITQQLIKNNVFETGGFERSTGLTIRRKIQEWNLAMQLEEQMSKEEILLSYLNTINLGSGNYGVKEAASYYFGKELKDLTLSECAVIASITQNPSANNPSRYHENNWKRASSCLLNMLENGHITQAEYDAAIKDKDNVYGRIVAIASNTAGNVIYSYYIDACVEQVLDDLQTYLGYTSTQAYNAVYSGGLQIYSNEDPKAQEIIDTEINDEDNYVNIETSYSISWNITILKADGSAEYYNQNHITNYFKEQLGDDWYLDFESKEAADEAVNEFKSTVVETGDTITYEKTYYTLQPQASFTLMNYETGAVIAIGGGRGTKETSMSLNRATGTYRQPGSTFKVVAAFGPALDMGVCTLATTFDDEAYNYEESGKSIRNWWGDSYRGLSTIREGIRDSMNIIACKTMLYAGGSNCLEYLKNFGYSMIGDYDLALSTAIGGLTYGVTNLENCAAYSAIANDGLYRRPMFYSKVVNKDGVVLLDMEQIQETRQVISVETASLLTDAMQDVVDYGTGQSCDISNAPLAGKTGTTNDYRDLWFVGYVPNGLCGSIWVGYDENLTLDANNEVQKQFYSTIMEQLVAEQGAEGGEFELKGNIVQATVCSKSGLLSNGECSNDQEGSTLITEYFTEGTVPTTACNVHVKAKICKTSGKLATEYCPEDEVEELVVRRRDDGITDTVSNRSDTSDTKYELPEEECDIHTKDGTVVGTDEDGKPIYETTTETTETTETTDTTETTTAADNKTTAETKEAEETTTTAATEPVTEPDPVTEPETEPVTEPEPETDPPTEEEPEATAGDPEGEN